jgi:hypothetical protein
MGALPQGDFAQVVEQERPAAAVAVRLLDLEAREEAGSRLIIAPFLIGEEAEAVFEVGEAERMAERLVAWEARCWPPERTGKHVRCFECTLLGKQQLAAGHRNSECSGGDAFRRCGSQPKSAESLTNDSLSLPVARSCD